MYSGLAAKAQPLHPLREFQHHVILQIGNALQGGGKLALLHIGIAEGEDVLRAEPTLNGCTGHQRGRHHEDALHLPQQLLLLGEGIVLMHGLQPVVRRKGHVAALPLQLLLQTGLLRLVDGHVLQRQLFTVEDVIDGAQHLHDALQRQADDALHPCTTSSRSSGGTSA